VLNLTYVWLRKTVSAEDWNDNFKILDQTPQEAAAVREASKNWGNQELSGRGEFKLVRAPDPDTDSAPALNFRSAPTDAK